MDVNGAQVEFFFSENWWLTTEIFLQMVETFCATWTLLHPGLHARLFLNNLSVHKNAAMVKKLEKKYVFLVFFPLGATHIVQPLDFWVFATFEASLERWVREQLLSFHGRNAQKDVKNLRFICATNKLRDVSTHSLIKGSFREAGVTHSTSTSSEPIRANSKRAWGCWPEEVEENNGGEENEVSFLGKVEKVWERLQAKSMRVWVSKCASGVSEHHRVWVRSRFHTTARQSDGGEIQRSRNRGWRIICGSKPSRGVCKQRRGHREAHKPQIEEEGRGSAQKASRLGCSDYK